MITIRQLSKELSVSEAVVMDRALSMHIKLRQRGKAVDPEDADRIRAAFAPEEPADAAPAEVAQKPVAIPPVIGIKDLAALLEASPADLLKILLRNGVIANLNAEVDFDTAAIIADELGFVATEEKSDVETELEEAIVTENRLDEILAHEDPKKLVSRPPVITIMGHVDHGKTSLLDAIRETNVTAGEEGGITQHIGAYQVEKNDRKITFLDTPGHEAFTAMRARGAKVTDIAVLVVAADDGVQPQTVEAMDHALAAGVPIIVAVNKMDKEGADPDRVKRELAEHELIPEEWGGSTIYVPISAKKRQGIEELLEVILLVADIQDLKANPDRPAVGTIVEAKKTASKGVTATVLIQSGTLSMGDPVLVGSLAGRIKLMSNDLGEKIKVAPPSTPVEFLGLADVPAAGDILQVVEDERTAGQLSDMLKRKERAERLRPLSKISLESFYEKHRGVEIKTLNLVVKADVQGSVEAIKDSLKKLETDEVKVKVIHSGTGDILPTDVTLAAASDAVVIGFNVKRSPAAMQAMQQTGVDVRLYGIIYKLLEDVQKAMGGLLAPEDIVVVRGKLEIKGVFSQNRDRWTIGGFLHEGSLTRGDKVRIRRGEQVLGEADIVSLRREDTDVKVVKAGVECGLLLKKVRGQIKEGDYIETYIIEQRERTL